MSGSHRLIIRANMKHIRIFERKELRSRPYFDRNPLGSITNSSGSTTSFTSLSTEDTSLHEVLIRRLLNKPFKIPIPNYSPSLCGR